jgi:2-polyprenyl-3-methyl-5-hydroxy-6-metoxy-1,4-benzoquinol methylase
MSLRTTVVTALKRTRPGMVLKRAVERLRDVPRAAKVSALVVVRDWERPACVLCGGRAVTPHHRYNGFEIVRCESDGLMYVSPRPVDTSPFYDGRYYTDPQVGYRDYAAHAADYASAWGERLDEIEQATVRKGALLDVGCATGDFLALAQRRGWQVSGIELSAWAVEQARARHGLEVTRGSLPNEALGSASFDVVTFFDCVEHVREPLNVLVDIRRLLVPGGVLLLSTGALAHEDPTLESQWYYPPWHLYYFSRETMTALLAKAGFEVLRYVEKDSLMHVLARARERGAAS